MPSAYKAKKIAEAEARALAQAGAAPAQDEEVAPPSPKVAAEAVCPSMKVRHETEREAWRSARDKMLDGAPRLSAYRCAQCEGWHLTSSTGRPPPKRRGR